eukprot:GHRR01035348.1.p1 GENE.GHRR01035348.1~~GHRR01035348.1.p1  ORF type:complete len:171 (+),score=11.48 GHRR01035348.1:36-548(+)
MPCWGLLLLLLLSLQAVTWIYLSWRDPRTRGLIEQNEAKLIEPNSTYVCSTPCQSNQIGRAGGCCDGVWTPYIAFTNIKWLPQDRVARYGLGFDRTSDSVFQWRSVHATYYTPMDLRAFPFDKQHLLIQVRGFRLAGLWQGIAWHITRTCFGCKGLDYWRVLYRCTLCNP